LPEAIDLLESNNAYTGMVLLKSCPAFLKCSDNKEIIVGLFSHYYANINVGIDEFQTVSMRLKYSRKPIVAAVHGMALGGGCEFAMHASRIVAHVDSYIGLVEVGVGLIPAGGGLKELLQRGMRDLNAYGMTDFTAVLQKYLMQVATAAVSKNAFEAKKLGYLLETDIIVMQLDDLARRAKEEVLRMAKDGFHQRLPMLTKVSGNSGYAAANAMVMSMVEGGYVSEYDGEIALKIAKVLTGGDVPNGTLLTEKELMGLECDGFAELIHNPKTHERISGMASTGRPVRN
jgi:3-hydroxyacyl-CoA dehydrogenase